jgi:hypothetical protein
MLWAVQLKIWGSIPERCKRFLLNFSALKYRKAHEKTFLSDCQRVSEFKAPNVLGFYTVRVISKENRVVLPRFNCYLTINFGLTREPT